MDTDVVVVGGGISGMVLAQEVARAGRRVTVLEERATAGGCLHTERLPDGYWFEMGAHTAYNSYQGLLGVLQAHGALDKLVPRQKAPFRLLTDRGICSVGSQLSFPRLLWNAPRALWTRKAGRTVRGYYGALVGEQNYQRVMGPLFAAVPSQRADDFPAEMMFKPRPRRKDAPRSFTLQGGLRTAVDVLAQAPGVTVRCGARVTGVSRQGAGFAVGLADGSTQAAPVLALAVPPDQAARLLGGVVPSAADALAGIQVARIRTVGAVVARAAARVEAFAGVIPLDNRFYSCVSRDVVPDDTHRGFALHVAPTTTREAALTMLAALVEAAPGALQHVAEREVTLPSPRLGHAAIIARVDQALAGLPLLLTGNYFAGLAIEDCVQRSLAEAGRLRALSV